jgi:RNA polymerase sigma-70 factor (ECF subfamily)
MLAFHAGDVSQFEVLLERHHTALVGFLYKRVRDRAVAEELAQEAFLRVYRSRNYQPTARFRTWLYHIATNLARNWVRDHRVEDDIIRLDHPVAPRRMYVPRSTEPNIEERLISRCGLAEVRSAIDGLPEQYRRAVVMHKYRDMQYWEIAEEFGCSVPALKSLLYRSYELLRVRLAHLAPCRTMPRTARHELPARRVA